MSQLLGPGLGAVAPKIKDLTLQPGISQERMYQLINSSMQSGKPLYLAHANLRGIRLQLAQLCEAQLIGARLYTAHLQGANLSWADLKNANLMEADLQYARLDHAYLYEADLQMADLSEANLHTTNLRGADLSGADLTGAKYSAGTLWPQGFEPEAAGAVLEDTE